MTDQFDLDGIVSRIAAFGLLDAESSAPLTIGQERWEKVLGRLNSDRITGFAVAAAEEGWFELSASEGDALLEAHTKAMLAPLGVERALLEVASEFQRLDVEFVVLKGPALAHTVYPDPSWRFFGDLDLLVRAKDWQRVCSILQKLGYRRDLPEPRAGFDERFGKAAVFRRQGGIEVDLHRTLVLGPFGLWIEPEKLFEGTTELQLWDRMLRRLDDTFLQLHACIHASLGWWPPLKLPVRDVAQVAHFGNVDWHALGERSARWHLGAVVRDALQTASRTLGVGLPAEAESLITRVPSRKEVRVLRNYVTDRRAQGGTALSTLGAIRGLRPKLAYIRALLFPDRAFLAARARGSPKPTYLRRMLIPVGWIGKRWRSRKTSRTASHL
jgi:putative nucleotidyltransferase-like protein